MLTPEQETDTWAELAESAHCWATLYPGLSRCESAISDHVILAVDTELVELRQQNQCLNALLNAMRDGSNAHAANLSRMARENVELHAEAEARDAEILTCWEMITRYKAALEIYADDGNWTYNTANDDCIWARDEHGATTAARALHEDDETEKGEEKDG